MRSRPARVVLLTAIVSCSAALAGVSGVLPSVSAATTSSPTTAGTATPTTAGTATPTTAGTATPTTANAATPTYTNLVTDADQQELREAMSAAGLSGIDQFFATVRAFNAVQPAAAHLAAQPTPLAANTMDKNQINLDFIQHSPYRADVNCRLTAFGLLGSSITVSAPPATPGNYLMFDLEEMSTDPAHAELQAHRDRFVGVFNEVSVVGVAPDALAAAFLQADSSRGVAFGSTAAHLVRVVLHDPDEHTLFVGHTGVAIAHSGGWWFVEKLAKDQPFQFTRFSSMSEIAIEMRRRYATTDGAAPPIVLDNRDLVR